MKETGIIMSGDHPKLILDGRKTQTRRVIPPSKDARTAKYFAPELNNWPIDQGTGKKLKCLYGQVGDRLWVRETWRILDNTMLLDDMVRVEYRADGQISKYRYGNIAWNEGGIELPVIQSAMEDGKWKPAHHLPHIISRLFLEITEVRVERVQEISPADCSEEGINRTGDIIVSGKYMRETFSKLWDSLNAKRGYGWEVNPWVWVISFKVMG